MRRGNARQGEAAQRRGGNVKVGVWRGRAKVSQLQPDAPSGRVRPVRDKC